MATTANQHPAPTRPLLIFDGDCAFCTSAVDALIEWLPVPPETVPYQRIDLAQFGLTEADAAEQIWLIEGEKQFGGYVAVSEMFKKQPTFLARFLGHWSDTFPISLASGVVYRWVAANREKLPGGTPACAIR